MNKKIKYIKPGIVNEFGNIIYPTNNEWILAFALRGCKWAQDIIKEKENINNE